MKRMNRSELARHACVGGLAALTACVLFAGGCKSKQDHYSYRAISKNLTPELQGISERPLDVDRNIAVVENVNWRLFWGDLGRVWYMDRPSILSPFPTVSTSGQPH